MFCFRCGADVSAQDKICPVCGASVNQTQESGPMPPLHKEVSFRERATAFGVDVLVLLLIWFVLFQFFLSLSFYLLPAVFVVYYTLCFGGKHAASFGQRCMRMRVVDTKTGGAPGYGRALLRAAVLSVSVGFLGLGCLLYFVTGGRMLHDILSGTRVVFPEEK